MPRPTQKFQHRLDFETGHVFLVIKKEGDYKEHMTETDLGTVDELKAAGRDDILAKIPASQIAYVESKFGYPDPLEFPVDSSNPKTVTLAKKLATLTDRKIVASMRKADKRATAEEIYLEWFEAQEAAAKTGTPGGAATVTEIRHVGTQDDGGEDGEDGDEGEDEDEESEEE